MGRAEAAAPAVREVIVRHCPWQHERKGIRVMPVAGRYGAGRMVREIEESMARTKQNERSANRASSVPVGATGGRTPPSKLTVALLVTSVLSATWAAAMLTPAGRRAYVYVFMYAEFYVGVVALVFLSITVMAGVLATDRMILSVRQRVLLQSAHRTTGVIAVAALGVHVLTKVAIRHVGLLDAFVPFLALNNTVYVGMGTLAAWFMVSVLWTGLIRARFIGRGKPWMWRSVHSVAYLAWPIALVHGLNAGRAAKTWVLVSYIGCIALVLVTLIVRLSVAINRKKDFSSSTSTGAIKPVGKLVPTALPKAKSRSGRREQRDVDVQVEPVSARVVADRRPAPRDPWATPAPRPAAEPRVETPAAAARADSRADSRAGAGAESRGGTRVATRAGADDPYRPARRTADEPRGRRYADEDLDDRADDRIDDRADDRIDDRIDDRDDRRAGRDRDDRAGLDRGRRSGRYADAGYADGPVRPRGRRRAVEDDDRGREAYDEPRYAERDTGYGPAGERPEPRRYADDDEPVRPRGRRAAGPERYDAGADSWSGGWAEPTADAWAEQRAEQRAEAWAEAPRPRRAAEEDTGTRSRRRAADEPPRGRRWAEDDDEPVRPRGRRAADDDAPRSRRRADDRDGYEVPQPRSGRYADEEPGDRDNGRHSRDLTGGGWDAELDPNYLPPDDTPTLIDMASRRARRSAEPVRTADAGRGTARGSRRRRAADDADDMYWRQLRGEAQ